MSLLPANPRAETRTILGLAWPIMLTSLNWTLMHLIDVAVVGHVSTAELGALAAGRAMMFVAIVAGVGLLSGVLVYAARAEGAGTPDITGNIWRSGLLAGGLVGTAMALALHLGAGPVLDLIGVGDDIRPRGVAVTAAMALALPGQYLGVASAFFLEGLSRPKRVMVIQLSMLPVNAVLAWAWAGGHGGLPALGAVGAAYATAVASALGALLLIGVTLTMPDARARRIRAAGRPAVETADSGAAAGRSHSADWRAAARAVPDLLWFGAMPGIASTLEIAGFSWLIVLSTQLGDVAASAFQLALSVHNLGFALAMGFASAAGVRAGNAYGEGDPLDGARRGAVGAVLAMATSLTISVIAFVFAHPLVEPFSNDGRVVTLAAAMMAGLAPFLVFDAVQVVWVYVLRALGDQQIAGLNSIAGFFLGTGVLGWWLVRQGAGPMALIWAAGAGMLLVAALQTARIWVVSARLRRQSASSPILSPAAD